jgi:anaerobic selenocysteine-containing dehydrogenase
MCACRCGIRVHITDGEIRYIDGNPDHPVNKGVICGKGSAGIMHQNSPARLRKPLLRTGERGAGEFREIEWDEALGIAAGWLGDIRRSDPRRLAFFTGRDQSQALTGWWAKQYGTPNHAAHGGFCSVNMAAAGIYTIGSAFWEFAEPDWDHTRLFMMFGVAEDHGSNPIKSALAKLKDRGAHFISVNPVQTGYSAIADEWIGINPGTDGLFVLALVHELLRAGRIDIEYLVDYTNAAWLIVDAPGSAEDGLVARDSQGRPLSWDLDSDTAKPAGPDCARPALKGEFLLPDGRRASPAFVLLAKRYLDEQYSPASVADQVGVTAEQIERIAAQLATTAFEESIELDIPWTDMHGRRHATTRGRPVSIHAMRGISAHSNGFQTCRAIHLLQLLLGSIDVPGGLLHKAPYPRGLDMLPRPAGKLEDVRPNTPLPGAPLGFPLSPEDLLVNDDGSAVRIDKAYSWEAPLSAHGMMHTVITNAFRKDPYPIDTLFMYMANMAWNSSMNTAKTMEMLSARNDDGEYVIPHIIYCDAFASETVAYADLVFPDTTYLERWDAISMLDRPISSPEGPADAIRQPVMQPKHDVRPFQDVLLDLGARLGLEGMVDDAGAPQYPDGYRDYLVNHERAPGVGTLAGFRGEGGTDVGKGAVNPSQLDAYIENGCYWREELAPEQRYYRHANRAYLDYAVSRGFIPRAGQIPMNLYSEELQRFRLAARGHGEVTPPEEVRERVETHFDPLPYWYAPFEHASGDTSEYPLRAITQRPMAMYHSWGGQNAWLRQIHGDNRLYVAEAVAHDLDIATDDWVWAISRNARICVQIRVMKGLNANTVWTWNAIGKRRGAWNLHPDATEATQGFLLNHLIDDCLPESVGPWSNSDPVTGQAAWYDLVLRIEPLAAGEQGSISPDFPIVGSPPGLETASDLSQYGRQFRNRS